MLFIRYIKISILIFLILIFVISAFNLLVDPYSIYNSKLYEGINVYKFEAHKHLRMIKAEKITQIKPKTIILGTSKAEYGIDPDHTVWENLPVYNASLTSGNIYEMYRYMQHAHATKNLKTVLLALDLISFKLEILKNDFDENRLSIDMDGNYQKKSISNLISPIISLDATKSSIKTVFNQKNKIYKSYLSNGMIDEKYEWDYILKKGGVRNSFINDEKYYCKKVYENFTFNSKKFNAYQIYEKLLKYAYKNNLDLHIIISPYHARKLQAIKLKGLQNKFENWKSNLTLINEKVALEYSSTPYNVWDFSGYNSYNTISLPTLENKKQQLEWFWESTHYKKKLGDLMLAEIFDSNNTDTNNKKKFGKKITSHNINNHLKKIQRDQISWEKKFKHEFLEVKKNCEE
jgi:hypothetical protein